MPDWPKSLDALEAAPRHHTVLLENDRVRVLDTKVPPGDTVPLHTHRWPSVLQILSWSDFIRRDEHGRVVVDSRATGRPAAVALWSEPLAPHTLENVGTADLHVIAVEIKST